MKKMLGAFLMLATIASCSNTGAKRDIASRWGMRGMDGAETGVYISKDIRDNSGVVGVLREMDLTREYSGDNLKGVLIEVLPYGGMERRAQIDVVLNGRTIETHNIMLRKGRQELWTEINQEIRDDIRQLQIRYNPMEVGIQTLTVLINDDRRQDDQHGNGVFTQTFERIDRRRGGDYYTLPVPRYVNARYMSLEAVNYPVMIHEITVDGRSIEAPRRPLSPYNPIELTLPEGAQVFDVRIRAEGFSGDSAGLKVTVSERPLVQPAPGPGPGPNPWPNPNPGPHRPNRRPMNDVKAYSDDNCRNLVTPVTREDSCEKLSVIYGNNNVWSVGVNGRCINTVDNRFPNVCRSLQGLASEPVPPTEPLVRLYSDDGCKNTVLDLDDETNCENWMGALGSMNVWSVAVEGRCLNIPDVKFSPEVCNRFKRGAMSTKRPDMPDSVELFTDDACRNKITGVQRGDRCEDMAELFGSLNVWSIKFRGRCENIPDVNFITGCRTYAR